eukprot:gnl/Chilomastix_cuspidata/260.p1 GENE.gnl/Chilomastix_cuspidata/260~~gnl/Chilomastix_cuspidata/260.p1  ORF type:complete len:466 (+),score=172.60 gnl/Chilomastix_cuspidata/260:71-1468(+)
MIFLISESAPSSLLSLEAISASFPHRLNFTSNALRKHVASERILGRSITFLRNVSSLVNLPHLLDSPELLTVFKEDEIAEAKKIVSFFGEAGTGAYTDVQGVPGIRESIAKYIEKRDGFPSSASDIFMTDGATPGVQMVLRMAIREPTDGVMYPVPQYPLYPSCVTLYGGAHIHYYLDEESDWGLTIAELERAYTQAQSEGVNPKVLCVINPGNPTGQVLSRESMEGIVRFCHEKHILLLSDEVYQDNIYLPEKRPWESFKKVVCEMGLHKEGFELISVHSISKGFVGECGHRGGYFETLNIDPLVKEVILRLTSLLCVNSDGQIMTHLMVSHPAPGAPSRALFEKEYYGIYESLKRKAIRLRKFLVELEGVTCREAFGSLYLFPRIAIPPRAIAEARHLEIPADEMYCIDLLTATGLLVTPGSSFGQAEGTYHVRFTVLPDEEDLSSLEPAIAAFHAAWMRKWE